MGLIIKRIAQKRAKINNGYTQGRNHVFKVGGPIPWSRVLLPFYRKKLDRSTQFGAVGYIITLIHQIAMYKLGSVQSVGRSGHPDSPWLRPWLYHMI